MHQTITQLALQGAPSVFFETFASLSLSRIHLPHNFNSTPLSLRSHSISIIIVLDFDTKFAATTQISASPTPVDAAGSLTTPQSETSHTRASVPILSLKLIKICFKKCHVVAIDSFRPAFGRTLLELTL